MSTELISIQLTPVVAKFIRTKVKNGDYPSPNAVIIEAIERMRTSESSSTESKIEASLTKREIRSIGLGVKQGLDDLDNGRYDEFDVEGLRTFASNLVAASPTSSRRAKVRKKT